MQAAVPFTRIRTNPTRSVIMKKISSIQLSRLGSAPPSHVHSPSTIFQMIAGWMRETRKRMETTAAIMNPNRRSGTFFGITSSLYRSLGRVITSYISSYNLRGGSALARAETPFPFHAWNGTYLDRLPFGVCAFVCARSRCSKRSTLFRYSRSV